MLHGLWQYVHQVHVRHEVIVLAPVIAAGTSMFHSTVIRMFWVDCSMPASPFAALPDGTWDATGDVCEFLETPHYEWW
jgi:hypothetical protein